METFIVEFLQPEAGNSESVFGVAHRVGEKGRTGFRSFEEIRAILGAPRRGRSIWEASGVRPDREAYERYRSL